MVLALLSGHGVQGIHLTGRIIRFVSFWLSVSRWSTYLSESVVYTEKEDFKKFAEDHGYTMAEILPCSIDLADLIVAYGSQGYIVEAIHSARKDSAPFDRNVDGSTAEEPIIFGPGSEYYILVYYDKEPPKKGLNIGCSLVDFISGNGDIESAKQKALEASGGVWNVDDYSIGGNGAIKKER